MITLITLRKRRAERHSHMHTGGKTSAKDTQTSGRKADDADSQAADAENSSTGQDDKVAELEVKTHKKAKSSQSKQG